MIMLMRREYVFVLLIFLTSFVPSSFAQPQTNFANHYILLIDGSGSLVLGKAKTDAFYKMLRDTIATALFKTGFGATIPPCRSAIDQLSICDFGIVDGKRVKKDSARLRLREHSFKKDFIHIRANRQAGWTFEKFKKEVAPSTWYQIQVIAWAKPLALWALRQESGTPVDKTFLIFVSDRQKREDTEEIADATALGDEKSAKWANEVYDQFPKEYFVRGGLDSMPWAWHCVVNPGKSDQRIFADAYHVGSRRREAWRKEVSEISNFLKADWTWSESNDAPVAKITASFAPTLQNVLDSAEVVSTKLFFSRGANTAQATRNDNSVFTAGLELADAPCENIQLFSELELLVNHLDPILGKSPNTFHLTTTNGLLKSPSCASSSMVFLTLFFILAAGGTSAGVVFLLRKFSPPPVSIRVKGYLAKNPMVRNHQAENKIKPLDPTILPEKDREAFRIVPTRAAWWQRIVLPHTAVKFKVNEIKDSENLENQNTHEFLSIQEDLKLPLTPNDPNCIIRWKKALENPVEIVISLSRNGGDIAEMKIRFPKSEFDREVNDEE